DMYTNVVKCLFPQDVYPSQSTLKESLKDYLEKMYPDFMSNISTNEFTNRFHTEWSSSVCYNFYRL
ncbi:18650_t:CDS:1, partial [Racocetra persica]